MNHESYQKAKEVFHAALERPPAEREQFLIEICADNHVLRQGVEGLLGAYQTDFLEQPAVAKVAESFTDVSLLAVGQTIGHYEIRNKLGAGGMGEVFLAHDKELKRLAAIKVLHSDVATDMERVRRFLQEARAASALNHPNILTIYEVGESDGRRFIASEYIAGETLRERLKRDSLSVAESVEIAVQIAGALNAAHKAGIIHRDIKPENVILREDGLVKVLDFGLAKLAETKNDDLDSKTATLGQIQTEPGMVMGTAAYMSPEQTRGKHTDARTDVWSFGVCLYEMLTGKQPFTGETTSDIIAVILKSEPAPISDINGQIPVEMEQLPRKALRKISEERYQTFSELLIDLRQVRKRLEFAAELEHSNPSNKPSQAETKNSGIETNQISEPAFFTVNPKQQHRSLYVAGTMAVVSILVVAALVLSQFLNRENKTLVTNAPTQNRNLTFKRLARDSDVFNPAISPDGKLIVYRHVEHNESSLWTKNLATEVVTQIMPAVKDNYRWGSAHYEAARFSPDGRWIYYKITEEQKPCSIVQIPVSGGEPRSIVPCGESNFAVSPDGKQLAFVRGYDLIVADADGKGERTLAKRGDGKNWFNSWSAEMSWSPDGTKIAIGGGRREPNERLFAELIEISVADGSEKLIPIPKWNFVDQVAWLSDSSGLLVIANETYSSEGQIFHIAYPSGETHRITNDISNYVRLSVSADSNLLVADQVMGQLNIWAGKLSNANNLEQITFSQSARDGWSGLAFLPDGNILYSSPRNGNIDLWTMKPDGSEQNQLTRNAGDFNGYPEITSDGRFIVFTSSRTGEHHIWRMDINGRNSVQLTHGLQEDSASISADGKWVYYQQSEGKGFTINKVSINGGESVLVSGNLNAGRPKNSPDGRFIVYIDINNKWKTGLITAQGKKIKFFDFNPIRHIFYWTPDSKSLIYLCRNSRAICQSFIDGISKPQIIADYKNAWLVNFAVSTDRDKLIVSRGNYTNEAVLITDFK